MVDLAAPLPPATVARLCDRRRGVGGDGVLAVLPPRQGGAAFMHVTNSDGSVATVCGNGVRCVARHLAHTRGLGPRLVVETDSGPKACDLTSGADGGSDGGADGAFACEVEMGPGRWLREEVFALGGERLVAQRVSMGNPHAVVLGDEFRAVPAAPRARRAAGPAPLGGGAERPERRLRHSPGGRARPGRVGARRRPHPGLRHRRLRGGAGRGEARPLRPGRWR